MTGSFLKIKCSDCSAEQVVYERAASNVDCLVCGANMARPTAGRAVLKGEVVGRLD